MNSKDYWQIFMETGAPEMYLFYNIARKSEEENVSYGSGSCAESHKLQ